MHERNVAAWFRDLMIASTNRDDCGTPGRHVSALAARRGDDRPEVPAINRTGFGSTNWCLDCMAAALKNEPLPDRPRVLSPTPPRRGRERFPPGPDGFDQALSHPKGDSRVRKLNPLETNPGLHLRRIARRLRPDPAGGSRQAQQLTSLTSITAASAPRRPRRSVSCSGTPRTTSARSGRETQPRRLSRQSPRPGHHRSSRTFPKASSACADQARFALGYYHAKAKQLEEYERRRRRARRRKPSGEGHERVPPKRNRRLLSPTTKLHSFRGNFSMSTATAAPTYHSSTAATTSSSCST